jgi:light-harvesting complex I chlorophyll a/b binding protein 1
LPAQRRRASLWIHQTDPNRVLCAVVLMPSMMKTLLVGAALVACSEAFGGGGKAAPKKVAKKVSPAKKPAAKKVVARKAPVRKAAPVVKRSSGPFSPESDIGVTPPLGLFDPLNFLSRGPDAYRRYQEIEIKHGRLSMAATLGVIVTEAGIRLPGSLSPSNGLDFTDVPGSLEGAYDTVPLAGWAQIVALIAALDIAVFRQLPENDAGDVVQDVEIEWVRYSDPAVKAFKLNAERNNGRAAMFGIIGMISHVALGQDALFPIISK